MSTVRAAAVLLLALLVAGCGSLGGRGEAGAPSMAMEKSDLVMAEAGEPAPAPMAAGSVSRDRTAQPPAVVQNAEPAPAAKRLRVYTGFLELVVNEVERAREAVIQTAGQLGGHVESTTEEYVVVRIPAARLEEAMQIVTGLGQVTTRTIETADVTDQYADLGRRIEIARHTRDRLYTLLDRTTDVEERVSILREIRRLTEQIEGMSSALTLLAGQIELSRLTVHLVSRIEAGDPGARRIPFPWIAYLDPLHPSGGPSQSPITVGLPDEYAVFQSGKRVQAEAADGTRIAVGVVTNVPAGTTVFWRDALRFHLADLYRALEPVTAGAFEGAVFESKDIVPFHYLVAVAVRGGEIVVAEVFFPDTAAREKRLASLESVLAEWKP